MYGSLRNGVGSTVAGSLWLTGRSIDAANALRLDVVSPDPAESLARGIARALQDSLLRTAAKLLSRLTDPLGTQTLEL